jgi:hypothetical protein
MTMCSMLGASAVFTVPALAGPIDVDRLDIKRTATREWLTFSARDPSWTLPAPSPSDDGPGPIRVELFSSAEPFGATLTVPELASPSVWRVSRSKDGLVLGFRLRNSGAPNEAGDFSSARLRNTGRLRLVARRSGLTLDAPQGQVGIRITLATGVLCALFHGDTVVTDRAGKFVGKGARAADIPDCETETLGGATPCGATPGVYECTGECPPGEQCVVDDPFTPTCHCVGPASPCGDTAPMCNGTCPDGSTCTLTSSGTFPTCGCLAPGACGDFSTYPTCGGSCDGGMSCYPYSAQTGQFLSSAGCTCATPGPCSCGGGFACPPGQICRIQQVPSICIATCQ